MLGMERPTGNGLVRLANTLSHLGAANQACLIITLTVLAVIVSCEFMAPRWPGALIAVIGAIIASHALSLGHFGVQMMGKVPQGLPYLKWPAMSLDRMSALFSMSFSCAIVILAQSAATARAYAVRDNDAFDEDSDLIGLGVGNLVSALSGSFVVNGSPTKTAIVNSAGGRSQMAQITMAILVILVLLFLTGPLAALPNSVLSAVVFVIGIKLVDRHGMTDLFRRNRKEFWLALLTATTVVVAGVMPGIVLALVMSMLYHVRTSYKPQTALLSPSQGGHWTANVVGKTPVPQPEPGLAVYWFGADLFYANVGHFVAQVHWIAKSTALRWLLIDAGSITAIDYSADRDIAKLSQEISGQGTELAWVHVRGELEDELKSFKTLESLRDCLAAYRRSTSTKVQ